MQNDLVQDLQNGGGEQGEPAAILVYGRDDRLLETRRWVLKRAGLKVRTTTEHRCDLQGSSHGPRTLQRRLQDSGSSFQRVLDGARHQMARYYLSNSALELNEAAYLLGFEYPNSFG
ncbi:helix-turn-helix domain-containing protein [Granulicella arctica]|uniref:helix-turn-helix domain-containing protein n=1 Tax=Granulicella arctica TaxID=940613 RepID=UPI0037BF1979